MEGRSPHPASRAPQGTVVPIRAPRPHVPGLYLHMTHLTADVPALVVITDDDQVYLFHREILTLAGDLLAADPASLVQAGAGLDVTKFLGADRAALGQTIAICRARQQGNRS